MKSYKNTQITLRKSEWKKLRAESLPCPAAIFAVVLHYNPVSRDLSVREQGFGCFRGIVPY